MLLHIICFNMISIFLTYFIYICNIYFLAYIINKEFPFY